MLNIEIVNEHKEDEVWDIDTYFDNVYEPEWIDNDFAKALIKDVDKSTVIAPRIIDSPYLGYIPPTLLSGGVKCVLCIMFDTDPRWTFNITRCGDNCAKWLQRIGGMKDVTVRLSHLMKFDDSEPLNIRIVNNGKECKRYWDFLEAWSEVGF